MGPIMLQCDCSLYSILNKSINKNSILFKYNEDCNKLGYSGQLTSTKKGKPTHLPTTYLSIFKLVCNCLMKPDKRHYYRVQDLWFKNVIAIVLKPVEGYLSGTCVKKLHCLSQQFNKIDHWYLQAQKYKFFEAKRTKNWLCGPTKYSSVARWPSHSWNYPLLTASRNANMIRQMRIHWQV
jgi:hypothetical protein